MEPRELRVTNIVYDKDKNLCTIFEIKKNELTIKYWDKQIEKIIELKDATGIKLNPQLLIDLGFISHDNKVFCLGESEIRFDSTEECYVIDHIKRILFVHQLQNYIYCIYENEIYIRYKTSTLN